MPQPGCGPSRYTVLLTYPGLYLSSAPVEQSTGLWGCIRQSAHGEASVACTHAELVSGHELGGCEQHTLFGRKVTGNAAESCCLLPDRLHASEACLARGVAQMTSPKLQHHRAVQGMRKALKCPV